MSSFGGGGGRGSKTGKQVAETLKPVSKSRLKKMSITAMAKEMAKRGYEVTGVDRYDLKNKVGYYKVKGPDGKTRSMSTKEIDAKLTGQSTKRDF